ncbi:hypothetical protein ADUPG1_012670 [Aduncisulcus paluster]|uniref:RING-type domain-containing protein n=1 Tax=Aduncisulcus paluster TaxID=2918883 RepID=A0ABQ5K083_9EUKA|nr:hypothetical protein ADUPG1_012670 [Aduncisulcus paluster]|eukprot:gnl/Carplike_NY0171/4257_a5761_389.p1 GENE.gnl/Carplike_NY0171/4257_a5761_389~~gnl/Carplike_NY0171/4257_a5761_389.p1  ORF type:complete len:188 (-),score=29.05 gnl/Carplike_NY0171/4257_a5761_389:338-901(-)
MVFYFRATVAIFFLSCFGIYTLVVIGLIIMNMDSLECGCCSSLLSCFSHECKCDSCHRKKRKEGERERSVSSLSASRVEPEDAMPVITSSRSKLQDPPSSRMTASPPPKSTDGVALSTSSTVASSPTSSKPVSKAPQSGGTRCRLCGIAKPYMIVLECGHRVICASCLMKAESCPECGAKISRGKPL